MDEIDGEWYDIWAACELSGFSGDEDMWETWISMGPAEAGV